VLCAIGLALLASPVTQAGDDAALPAPVARVLAGHKLPESNYSLYVQRVADGEVLVAHLADVPRNPASTIKLLTTYAALSMLSPGYRWKTEVYLQGVREGPTLKGDLVLRGTGDPYLTTENFWKLLRELRTRGIEHVTGDLIVDNFFFDVPAEDPSSFDGQPFRAYNVAPDALLVNFNAVRFNFQVDPLANIVRVVPDPMLSNLQIENRIKLGSGRCGGYQRGIAFNVPGGLGSDEVILEGRFPVACKEYAFTRTVMRPEEFAFGVFESLWNELGGRIDGSVRLAAAPTDTKPFFVYNSPYLGEIVRSINKYSNNVMTRHLLLTLGAEFKGEPGTPEKGIAVTSEWLASAGLEFPELVLVNGSGLSRDTRISAASLGAMLEDAFASPYMPEFIASLPLAAMDGTLRRRYRDEPLAGRLHMKTGRLDHVAGIAGYAMSRSGERYIVVSLHNDTDVHRGYGENVQDAVLRWVFEQ
jgi:D-alanyl-D-alanine carboxypeptidase/D-alanyl-D-alanine-endopeptidase (penicillin-binding protein 4)